jgi:hypothetical protein
MFYSSHLEGKERTMTTEEIIKKNQEMVEYLKNDKVSLVQRYRVVNRWLRIRHQLTGV